MAAVAEADTAVAPDNRPDRPVDPAAGFAGVSGDQGHSVGR